MADSLGRVILRRSSAWQKVVALAPVLLFTARLPAEVMLRCRIDGMLRSACCCPAKQEAPSSQNTLRAADCCERAVVAANQLPAVVPPQAPDAAHLLTGAAAPATASVIPVVAPPTRIDWGAQRYGPAREGPPIVLLKHAFLI